MNHLIIGVGNMGRRHGLILEQLGDSVMWVDKNLSMNRLIYMPDSILICTPPETHIQMLKKFVSWDVPIFIEKPLFSMDDKWPAALKIPLISHVANNWHWCPHLPESNYNLNIGYKADKNGALDLMHFVDDPQHDRVYKTAGPHLNAVRLKKTRQRSITLILDAPLPFTDINSKFLQNHQNCPMFKNQMIYWRNLIKGKKHTINPIELAEKNTNWLIDQLRAK